LVLFKKVVLFLRGVLDCFGLFFGLFLPFWQGFENIIGSEGVFYFVVGKNPKYLS